MGDAGDVNIAEYLSRGSNLEELAQAVQRVQSSSDILSGSLP